VIGFAKKQPPSIKVSDDCMRHIFFFLFQINHKQKNENFSNCVVPVSSGGQEGGAAAAPANKKPLSEVLKGAAKQALGGGLPGAAAMAMQVRTSAMNGRGA
jgi:hypothetical protein